MNKLIFGLLGLIALLIVAALVGPSFIDWNRHKDRIAAEVRDLTGRAVAIGGEVELSLLPAPTLSAEEVRLSGAFGPGEADLLNLRELRLRIAWLPLLAGRVQMESVVLIEPALYLEVRPDGLRNWDYSAGPGQDEALGTGDPGRFGVKSFSLRDGVLSYHDRRAGPALRVERLQAEITAQSLAGPFDAKGSAEVQGRKAAFLLATGAFAPGRGTRSTLELELPEAKSRASFAGSLTPGEAATRVRGRFEAEGESLRRLLRILLGGRAAAVPGLAAMPFALSGNLEGDRLSARADNLALRLGEARLGGMASLRLSEGPDLDLKLRATRLDLDPLLSGEGAAPAGAAEGIDRPEDTADLGGFGLLADPAIALDLLVDAADYRGQALRDLTLRATLAEGRVAVEEASALLPGRSALRFDGLVTGAAEGPRLEGRVEARSDNLRRLSSWLGYRFGRVPPNRLRRLSLAGRLTATAGELAFHDLETQLDLTTLTGGVIVALRERPGLGIGLMADTLDLGSYLVGGQGAGGEGAPGDSADGEDPDLRDVSDLLDRFDANLDLRIGTLDYQGLTMRGVRADALLRDGSLTLREVKAEDLAGGKARLSGVVTALTGGPTIDGEVELDAREPRRLARLLGLDPTLLSRLGAVSLESGFKAAAGEVSFDATLAGLGGRLALSGTALLDSGPLRLRAEVEAGHPDLAGPAGGGISPGRAAVPFELRAALDGTLLAMEAKDLTARVGAIELSGRAAADLSGARPAITADLEGGALPWRGLAGLLGVTAKADRPAPASAGPKPRWSWAALDFSAWRDFDARLALRLRELVLDQASLGNLSLEAALEDGVLSLLNLTGEAYGGRLELAGQIRTSGRPDGRVLIRASAVDLGALLGDHLGLTGLSGPVEIQADLQTRGQSEAQLISALSGEAAVAGRLALAGAANRELGAAAPRPEELRSLADGLSFVAETFAGPNAELRGGVSIEDGILETRSLQLLGEAGRLEVRARADLPRWQLESSTELLRKGDGASPYLSLGLKGPLDEPDILLSGTAFEARQPAEGAGGEAAAGPGVIETDLEQLINDLAN